MSQVSGFLRHSVYSELKHGQRAPSSQKKCFSDHMKAILKLCSVPPDQLETVASDKGDWQDVCEEGLVAFDINYNHIAGALSATLATGTLACRLQGGHTRTPVAVEHFTTIPC